MKNIIVLLFIFGFVLQSFGQAEIKGLIVDKQTKQPIAYANISVFIHQDSLVTGAISNEKGKFILKNLNPDKYRLIVSFMGYQNVVFNHLILSGGTRDLGIIPMQVATDQLKEVVVTSGKPPVAYKVDRKIINASAFPEATVALDLLSNVPSLQVDVSGKITYRNDAVFNVFINGKPVANGVERLRQISTSQIDRVEIITNPSAKYAAEGTAGIINVVLKKNRLKGYRINSSFSYNTLDTYSFDFSIGRNTKRSEWYLDFGLANYKYKIDYRQTLELITENTHTIYEIEGEKGSDNGRNYINFGYNYDLTDKDEVDISFSIDPFSKTEDHFDYADYIEKTYNLTGDLLSEENYRYISNDNMTYQYFGPVFKYTRKFDKSGDKKLEFSADYYTYLKDFDELQINQNQYAGYSETMGSIYNELNEEEWNLDLDLTYPFNDRFSVESGGSISTDYIPQTTIQNGTFSGDELVPFPDDYYYQEVAFSRNIYAGYFSLQYTWNKWQLKSGLRYEFVDRTADFKYNYTDNPDNLQVRPFALQYDDWFPSVHLLYSFDKTQQFSVSYTKRINRANYFWLMPVKQYQTPYSYIIGDENILPTYIDSWEMNYQKSWDKDYVSAQVFVHQKDNLMTFYNRVDDKGLQYIQYTNAGNSTSGGVELTGNYHVFGWWNVNLSLSFYQYYLHLFKEGEVDEESNKLLGNMHLNQDFTLSDSFKLQLKARYNTPWIYLQKEGEAVYALQVSLQKRFNKHWKLAIYTNNLWGDIIQNTQTTTANVIIQNENRSLQYVGFKLSYNFNNRK